MQFAKPYDQIVAFDQRGSGNSLVFNVLQYTFIICQQLCTVFIPTVDNRSVKMKLKVMSAKY